MGALTEITQPPRFLSQQEFEVAQQSTPGSFVSLPPVLRFQLDPARVYLRPAPTDAPKCFKQYDLPASLAGADQENDEDEDEQAGITVVSDGSLWLTESELSFLSPDSSSGFSLTYPVISLHAVTRSPPAGLAAPSSSSSSSATGSEQARSCLYVQLDLSAEDKNVDEDDEDSLLEMHVFTPDDESLDQLFEALSQCASLHPSAGGGLSGDGSNPFAGFAPFGTGASDGMAVDGAFDDADEDDDDGVVTDAQATENGDGQQGGLSDAGRRNLAHLESVMVWPEDDDERESDEAAAPSDPQASVALQALDAAAAPTNTLILRNLPIEFFVPSTCSALLSLLNAYGTLVRWIPMPTVGRAVVVFEAVEGAKMAKDGLDRLLLPFEDESASAPAPSGGEDVLLRVNGDDQADDLMLRAVFGPSVSAEEAEASTLSVPTTDKNFLISPPGSPPVGWEPIREDPPNRDTLADDLMRVLGELRDTQRHVESHKPKDWGSTAEADARSGETVASLGVPAQAEVILAPSMAPALRSHQPAWLRPSDGGGGGTSDASQTDDDLIQVPGVTVQSFDPVVDDEDETGGAPRTHLGFTISSVKATVDSMWSPTLLAQQMRVDGDEVPGLDVGVASAGEAGGKRITPTSRPPLAG